MKDSELFDQQYTKYIIQLIFFFAFILPGAVSFNNPLLLFVFIFSEITIYLPFIFKKQDHYFFLTAQFQFYLLIILQILLIPQQFFQLENPSPKAIISIAVLLTLAESIILFYLIFQEKAIKSILFTLSLSTTIVVFLIVIFIMSEGLPAFQENDPIEFITGTEWQHFYNTESSESIQLTTTIAPYSFELSIEDSSIYLQPYNSSEVTIEIRNNGGLENTIFFELPEQDDMTIRINPTNITLQPNEKGYITLLIDTKSEGIFNREIIGISQNNHMQQTLEFEVIVSTVGMDLYPSRYHFTEDVQDVGNEKITIQLRNTGTMDDIYDITINASDIFRPYVDNVDGQWDYENHYGKVSVTAGEQKNITIRPMLTYLTEGDLEMWVIATSQNNPEIHDDFHVTFDYQTVRFLTVDVDNNNISTGGHINYTIDVSKKIGDIFNIIIEHTNDDIQSTLYQNNTVLLKGEGTIEYNNTSNKEQTFTLTIQAPHTIENGTEITTTFTTQKPGSQPTFGILPFIIGTIVTTAIALLLAAPLGLGCAILLAEYLPQRLRQILRPLYELLAGIPSVIYGLWGFLTFGPLISTTIYPMISDTIGQHIGIFSATSNIGRDITTASIVLSIMILPIIITLSEESIRVVRRELKEGSLALGTTHWQTIKHIIIPEAKSGIITSIILGTGRAIGETMAVLMIMGAYYRIPTSLFDSGGTMTSIIASSFGDSFTFPLARHALFAIGIVLFCMIFILNIFIVSLKKEKQSQKQKKKSSRTQVLTSRLVLLSTHTPDKYKNKKNRKRNLFSIKSLKRTDKTLATGNIQLKGKQQKNDLDYPKAFTGLKKNNQTSKARRNEKIIKIILICGAILASFFLFFILQDILIRGGLSLHLEYLYQEEGMGGKIGGFANSIIGSLQLIGIALAFAAPLSIGPAIYVHEYTKKDNIITKIILFTSDTLASTPSIIYGAFGFMFFVLYLDFKPSMIAGGLTLGMMIIPLMLRSAIEAIKAIPHEFQEGALALGATKWQAIKTVILPPAMPGITSGVIISMGRAIGETAAVMFTAGYAASIATSILHPTANMPNMIFLYYDVSTKFPEVGEKVYSAAFILILIVLILNFIAKFVSYRSSKMMKQ